MHAANLEPSLESLLDQYEDIGGPETFGPNGTAIILAVWRKSKKLGWLQTFKMTNTELHFQTGIKSRETLNTHRERLAEAGIIQYTQPPLGKSKGEYTIVFGIPDKQKVVQQMDNFTDDKGEVVQNMDSFTSEKSKAVQQMDNLTDTVLKDLKDTITITTITDPFEIIFEEFCVIHGKLDIHVKRNDIVLMQWMLNQNIPVDLIVKVMRDLYKERTAAGTVISTFVYYKKAILAAWESFKAITDRVPVPAVALGEESITSGVPVPGVALGSTMKRTKQQQEIYELEQFIEEEKSRGNR